jgi:hypothetical protein
MNYFNRIIIFVAIFAASASVKAKQTQLGLLLEQYCYCLTEVEGADDKVKLKFLKPHYAACKQTVYDGNFRDDGSLPFEQTDLYKNKLLKVDDKLPTNLASYSADFTDAADASFVAGAENRFICTPKRIQDWYSEKYKPALTKISDALTNDININVCEAEGKFKDKAGEVELCRKNLKSLIINYDEGIYNTCNLSFQTEKGKETDCLKLESFKNVIQLDKSGYFADLCYEEVKASKPDQKDITKEVSFCTNMMAKKILGTTNPKDFQDCKNETVYNTDDAKNVCTNFFLTKSLALVTEDDRKNLYNCMGGAKTTVTKDVKVHECLGKSIEADNAKEKEMLTALKNMYCYEPKFTTEAEKKKCLEDIILNNLSELDHIEGCESELDPDKKINCQRLKLYEKLLGVDPNNPVVAHACWHNVEKKSLKERQKCQEDAAKVSQELQNCLSGKEPNKTKYTNCYSKITPKDKALDFLVKSIRANNPGKEAQIAFCLEQEPEKVEKCLLNINSGLTADIIADQDCAFEEDFEACKKAKDETWTAPAVVADGDDPGQLKKNNGNVVTPGAKDITGTPSGINNTVPVIIGALGGGSTLASFSGGKGKGSNSIVNGLGNATNMSSKDEKFDLFRSFKNMKFKRHPDHLCKQIGKGATLRVIGTVAGVVTAGIVHAVVMKNYKEEKGQAKAFDHLKQGWKGVLAGVGVKLAFNAMANLIYKDTQAKATTVIVAEQRVPVCKLSDVPEKTKKEKKEENEEIEYFDAIDNGQFDNMVYQREVIDLDSFDFSEIAMFSELNSEQFEKTLNVTELDLMFYELNNDDYLQDLEKEYPGIGQKIKRTASIIIGKLLIGESIAQDAKEVNPEPYINLATNLPGLLDSSGTSPEENAEIKKEADASDPGTIHVVEESANGSQKSDEINKRGTENMLYIAKTVLPMIQQMKEDSNLSDGEEEEE